MNLNAVFFYHTILFQCILFCFFLGKTFVKTRSSFIHRLFHHVGNTPASNTCKMSVLPWTRATCSCSFQWQGDCTMASECPEQSCSKDRNKEPSRGYNTNLKLRAINTLKQPGNTLCQSTMSVKIKLTTIKSVSMDQHLALALCHRSYDQHLLFDFRDKVLFFF